MPTKTPPEVEERAKELRAQGLSFGQISTELGIPKATAHLLARGVDKDSTHQQRADANLTKVLEETPADEVSEETLGEYRRVHTERLAEEDRVRALRAQVEQEELQSRLAELRAVREQEGSIGVRLAKLRASGDSANAEVIAGLQTELNALREQRHEMEIAHVRSETASQVAQLQARIDALADGEKTGRSDADLWLKVIDKLDSKSTDVGLFLNARFDRLEDRLSKGPLPQLNLDGQSDEDLRVIAKALDIDSQDPEEIRQELNRRRAKDMEVGIAHKRIFKCGACGIEMTLDLIAWEGHTHAQCPSCKFMNEISHLFPKKRSGSRGGHRSS